jgi:hypothetical protein
MIVNLAALPFYLLVDRSGYFMLPLCVRPVCLLRQDGQPGLQGVGLPNPIV